MLPNEYYLTFRKGDVVKCIRDSYADPDFNLDLDNIYIIDEVAIGTFGGTLRVAHITLVGHVYRYSVARFVKIGETLKSIKIF